MEQSNFIILPNYDAYHQIEHQSLGALLSDVSSLVGLCISPFHHYISLLLLFFSSILCFFLIGLNQDIGK